MIAQQIIEDEEHILLENKKDLEQGEQNGLSKAVLDRIMLNPDRIRQMAEGVRQIVSLKDPIGEVLETIQKENGLYIEKRRVPIGVIGMIYEARPNVTVDAYLALKTGNAIVYRKLFCQIFEYRPCCFHHRALKVGPPGYCFIARRYFRKRKILFRLNEYLDVLIQGR